LDAKDFIKLLDTPQEVEKISVDELKKLSLEYPYSQPVQLLYAIRLSQSSEYLFSRQLGKTAVLTDDRSVLFDLFERDREEVGTTTVISQPPTQATKEVETPVKEKEPLISQLEAAIKPAQPKETSEPMDSVPEKPEVAPAIPITAPVKTVAEVPAPKLNLAGLSPKEKVQAILAENKRIREEMAAKKAGAEKPAVVAPLKEANEVTPPFEEEPTLHTAVDHLEPPTDEIPAPVQQPATRPEVPELPPETYHTKEQPVSHTPIDEPVAEVAASEPMESVEEEELENAEISLEPNLEEESPILFTIDDEVREPLFKIDDEPGPATVKGLSEPIAELANPEVNDGDTADSKPAVIDYSSEKHSLAEWLNILRKKEAVETEVAIEEEGPVVDNSKLPPAKKMELLDSFIEKLPEIKRKNLYTPPTDKPQINAGEYGGENDDMLVTETLAKVYINQRHYEKAIKAFEILKLKYPEKSSFFADQISEVRNLINSK
jgi:hypothetical protein